MNKRIFLCLLVVLITSLPTTAIAQGDAETAEETITIRMVPVDMEVLLGQVFKLQIVASTGEQAIAGAQVSLDFRAKKLEVLDLEPGNALPDIFNTSFDNETGEIDYAAGYLLGEAKGEVTLMTLRFRAKGAAVGTPLTFVVDQGARDTYVIYEEYPLPSHLVDTQVAIVQPQWSLFLPRITDASQ